MWSFCVVLFHPFLDEGSSLSLAVEDISIKMVISQFTFEAHTVSMCWENSVKHRLLRLPHFQGLFGSM